MGGILAVGAFLGVGVIILAGMLAMVSKFYRKVDQGRALIINKTGTAPAEVTFKGGLVLPIVHRGEVMDISVKTIEIDRRGKEGLICMDNIRADIKVTFFVRVNPTSDDVLKVAQNIGCERASHQDTLEELFIAKFSEALKTVGKRLEFVSLYQERDHFKDQIIEIIGTDLNGYALEDAAIDFLEQTPVESLDKDNILDAQGIKKITELTTAQSILTNDFRQNERKAIRKQDVEAEEAVLELDRQLADAQAKQAREIATMRARETAETKRVAAEEFARSEGARIKAEEEVEINEENKKRQVQVAEKNRERVIGIETERVEKDRMLEEISRERETSLERIQKDKAIEVEKKEIADVVRMRIAVEKTVAEEEERIKTLRLVEEAKRQKESKVVTAEGDAQEKLVMTTKVAEAEEIAARHSAKKILTMAEADLEAADKQAKGKIRIAEGVQAEEAASGLAEVRVKEANAAAIEKEGLARVRVKEADAGAVEKLGVAQANVTRGTLLAEAEGAQEKGLAGARVREAEAVATQKTGEAEGAAIKAKLTAEAAGLAQKAEAMRALDGVGREHEEFRIQLEKNKEIELAAINARKDIAKAQAYILKEAFSHANINIVGGDGQFFDKFVNAVSLGKSIDGAVENSSSLQAALGDYLNGSKSLPQDIKDVLTRPALSPGDIQSLSISGVLGKLMTSADGDMKGKLAALAEKAKELGIDQIGG